ncbi:MAG: hypothetical protein ACI935_003504, partial [Moritella dasanensis]
MIIAFMVATFYKIIWVLLHKMEPLYSLFTSPTTTHKANYLCFLGKSKITKIKDDPTLPNPYFLYKIEREGTKQTTNYKFYLTLRRLCSYQEYGKGEAIKERLLLLAWMPTSSPHGWVHGGQAVFNRL